MKRYRLFLLNVALFLLLGCQPEPVSFRNTDITGASFGRDFSLTDHHGQPRTLADFRGRAVIVFFGYTSCPDICPTTLARLAEAMKELGEDSKRVQVLFITLDPERDTLAQLKTYVAWFHPDFLGLRGEPAQIQELVKEYRVFASRHAVEGALGYVVDHSSGAYVYDPAGRLRLHVRDPNSVQDLVADLRVLLH